MPDEVRITIGVSKKARDRWAACAKKLGVSQWEMTDILFQLANHTNPTIIKLAAEAKERKKLIRKNKKALANRLKNLTSEQMKELIPTKREMKEW